VSAVRASPLLRRLVDLDVLDDQVAGIQTLGIRVRLGVLQQAEQELSRLDGPAGPADAKLLAYIMTHESTSTSLFRASSHEMQVCQHISAMAVCFTYLERHGQCHQHISSWAPPRHGSSRSPGRPERG